MKIEFRIPLTLFRMIRVWSPPLALLGITLGIILGIPLVFYIGWAFAGMFAITMILGMLGNWFMSYTDRIFPPR